MTTTKTDLTTIDAATAYMLAEAAGRAARDAVDSTPGTDAQLKLSELSVRFSTLALQCLEGKPEPAPAAGGANEVASA